MPWQVEYTNQFKQWWDELSEAQQDDLTASVELLGGVVKTMRGW